MTVQSFCVSRGVKGLLCEQLLRFSFIISTRDFSSLYHRRFLWYNDRINFYDIILWYFISSKKISSYFWVDFYVFGIYFGLKWEEFLSIVRCEVREANSFRRLELITTYFWLQKRLFHSIPMNFRRWSVSLKETAILHSAAWVNDSRKKNISSFSEFRINALELSYSVYVITYHGFEFIQL